MKPKPFHTFLTDTYRSARSGRRMSARAADDMVSRCRRVERVMGVDLDDALRNGNVASFVGDMDRASKKFAFAGNPKLGLSMMKSAVRKYGAFVSHKRG